MNTTYEIDGINFVTMDIDGGITIVGVDPGDKTGINLVVPVEIGGKKVIALEEYAFSPCEPEDIYNYPWENGDYAFNSITLQDNIKELPSMAFFGANAKVIDLGDKIAEIPSECFIHSCVQEIRYNDEVVTQVGERAFAETSELKKLKWPSRCKKIPLECFCSSWIKELEGIENVTSIGSGAFHYSSIKSFKWPSSCEIIPEFCFEGSQLESIAGIENVKVIGAYAFSESNITQIEWPRECTKIPISCFKNSGLESISGIQNVLKIGDNAFSGTRNLQCFTWPSSCKDIPDACFSGSRIKTISGIEMVETIGELAFSHSSITSFDWPKMCNVIPSRCFFRSQLAEINGIGNVKKIEAGAFLYTDLSSVEILKCSEIQSYAFTGTNLKELKIESPVCYIAIDGFGEKVSCIDVSACEQVTLVKDMPNTIFVPDAILTKINDSFEKITWKLGFDTVIERIEGGCYLCTK